MSEKAFAFFNPWRLDDIKPHPRYTGLNKEELIETIETTYSIMFPDSEPQQGGACLFWTFCACIILRMAGHRALLQAGSMNYPISYDLKSEHTHFSYEWDPTHPASAERIMTGGLPEVHVWCAIPDTGEIIDFSTRDFKRLAEGLHGLKWEAEDPPKVLWCHHTKLPMGVHYDPEYEAIAHVLQFLQRSFR